MRFSIIKFLVLFFLCFSSLSTFSQAPIGLYLLAGANQTTFKTPSLYSDFKTGYNFGFLFASGYHENYNYQFEVLLAYKPVTLKTVDGAFVKALDADYSVSGLDVGFYTNYYILTPDEDRLFLGPQAGLTLAFGNKFISKNDTQEKLLPYLISNEELKKLPIMNTSLGLGLTGGYNRFKFDLRYSLGLTNMLKSVQTNEFDQYNRYTGPTLEGKLNAISLNVSYLFYKRIKRR